MTKMGELQSVSFQHISNDTSEYFFFQKYRNADIDVVRKDGLILIREMATEVKNMMDFKMSAVKVSYRIF